MTDERFDHDLRHALREVAGEEAPMSLRYRLADQIAQTPPGRSLWFAPPLRLAAVAVAAVAVVALAILILPGQPIGPSPSVSPEPSPGASASRSPEASPTPSQRVSPTPAPTGAPAAWTGLVWSDPVTPPFTVHIGDLLPWDDGYVAVGQVEIDATRSQAAFLTSPDGLNWTVVDQFDPGVSRFPGLLVAAEGELLAFSHPTTDTLGVPTLQADAEPLLWRSADGVSWSLVDSPTWRQAWAGLRMGPMPSAWNPTQYPIVSGVADVAAGPAGLVAIGNAFDDEGMLPVVLHSADGAAWATVRLTTDSPSAALNSVVAYRGGFVIVGAVQVGPDPYAAVPAAWYSSDGLTWTRASVEDGPLFPDGLQGEFGPVAAGSSGLVACHGSREMGAGGPRYSLGWVSADGRSWEMEPDPNGSPACGWMASDGTRILALGPSAYPAWTETNRAWESVDGASWRPLTLSAGIPDRVEGWWVVPDGVIYSGVQSFWFGEATTAP